MNVGFHLYFPSEPEARRAAETLKGEGYAVEVRPSADAVDWITLASAEIDDKDFDKTEAHMESLARSMGGRFDGFEETG